VRAQSSQVSGAEQKKPVDVKAGFTATHFSIEPQPSQQPNPSRSLQSLSVVQLEA
jgi:hypothetical protein